jgi:ribosome-associated heat shock protein Hsp15
VDARRRKADVTREADAPSAKVRLDKWLWAARFFRTRTLAADAVETGQVRVAGERIKPARMLHEGDRVSVRRDGLVWDVVVTALSERRGGAAEAALLYRETEDSAKTRAEEVERRRAARASAPRIDGRPTKRDRRRLQDFLDEP